MKEVPLGEVIVSEDSLDPEKIFFEILPEHGFQIRLEKLTGREAADYLTQENHYWRFQDCIKRSGGAYRVLVAEEQRDKLAGLFMAYESTDLDDGLPLPMYFQYVRDGDALDIQEEIDFHREFVGEWDPQVTTLWQGMLKTAILRDSLWYLEENRLDDVVYCQSKAEAIEDSEFTPEALEILTELRIKRIFTLNPNFKP